jgi:hypothetical protein
MKILNIVESMLLEATPDEIYNSYYKDVPRNEFDQIVMADPLSLSGDSGIKRIGKYAKLLINLFRKKGLKLEDLPRAKEYLEYVYKHSVALDVNKIKSLTDLYDVVKNYYTKDTKDLGSIISALNEKEYKEIFRGRKFTIFTPLTERASCTLGVNTEWCTTWGPESLNPKHKDRGSLFSRYHNQGPLYILISDSDVNDKYQFHFESKQYMDREDKRINVTEFLNENPDVKNFFFPSLVSDDQPEEIVKQQIARMNALDEDDAGILVNKIVSKTAQSNPLIMAFVQKDEDKLRELITDEDISDFEIDRENFILSFKTNYGGSLETTKNTLSYYQAEAQSGYDMLWDRMNNEDSDYIKSTLEEYLEEYYKQNESEIKSNLGYLNYEQFKADQYDNFVESDNLWDDYSSLFVNKNYGFYEDAVQLEVDAIEKYVDFDDRYREEKIIIRIPYFLLFLIKKGYTSINGTNELMEDVLNEYVSYYNVDNDYEGIWDYQQENVTYDEMKTSIENYFEEIMENSEGVNRCSELRVLLNNTIQNVFKGKTSIDNDEFRILIPSLKIDCEKESINITYYNKKTGERFDGPVKVENLSSYGTNYKLFEAIVSFNKFL